MIGRIQPDSEPGGAIMVSMVGGVPELRDASVHGGAAEAKGTGGV